MNPFISVGDKQLNASKGYNDVDFIEDKAEVFQVVVRDRRLKLLLLVQQMDPNTNPQREYKVISCKHLYIDGLDNKTDYPPAELEALSSDPTITQGLFSDNLDTYGIVLNKVAFHSFRFFESVSFDFTNPAKLEELHDLINEACKKARKI
jgi:hypothetical protein